MDLCYYQASIFTCKHECVHKSAATQYSHFFLFFFFGFSLFLFYRARVRVMYFYRTTVSCLQDHHLPHLIFFVVVFP